MVDSGEGYIAQAKAMLDNNDHKLDIIGREHLRTSDMNRSYPLHFR